jgi:hypothetical protein
MTWAKIVASLLSILNWLAAQISRSQAKSEGRNEAELEARREADRVSDAARDAASRVSDDPADIATDPNNRRGRSSPLP